jgi:hypothetical protein
VSSQDVLNINWKSPGPVASRFMASSARIQIINGPVGSGKTTAAFMKAIRLAAQQEPSRGRTVNLGDGVNRPVRKFKLATIRDTYRSLWKTTIPSWFKRFPQDAGEWNGAVDAPAKHRLQFLLPDGTVCDFTNEFGAIGENSAEDFMRGYEPTAWYLNELDLLQFEVFNFAKGRWGRFPDMSEGGPTWWGMIADANAPEFESWLYRDIFTRSAGELADDGVELFVQPGGTAAGAENLVNLPPGYYVDQAKGQPDWYKFRMIENRPGYSRAGKPVHPEFKDAIHVAARELEPIPGLPLVVGIDPRTRPSAVFMQRLPGSQRRFIDELQGDQNMGPRRFGALLAQLLHDRFPFVRPEHVRGVVDPSSQYGADREDDEKSWLEIVAAVSGIRLDPAPTNKIDMRREALKKPFGELIDGEPAILISPRCRLLRTGLNTGFRYRKMNVAGAERFADEVEKNEYADICEAAEYACLLDGAEHEIVERKNWIDQKVAAARAVGERSWDYDPLEIRR